MTDEDGMRLGELEGIVAENEVDTRRRADAAGAARRPRYRKPLHDRRMSELQGGQKVRVLLAQALFGGPERCCSTSPPTTSISNPSTGCRIISIATRAR